MVLLPVGAPTRGNAMVARISSALGLLFFWWAAGASDPVARLGPRKQRVDFGRSGSNLCGGSVALNWQRQGDNALYVDVNTVMCRFHTVPQYVASITEPSAGTPSYIGPLLGVSSVLRPAKTRFRVVVTHEQPTNCCASPSNMAGS